MTGGTLAYSTTVAVVAAGIAFGALVLVTGGADGRGNAAQDPVRAVALKAAQQAASASVPTSLGTPVPVSNSWPTNVTSVAYLVTTNASASTFVGGGVATINGQVDERQVVVVRLTGDFGEIVSAPPTFPDVETGTILTVVVQASSGAFLESALGDVSNTVPTALPDATVLYQRS